MNEKSIITSALAIKLLGVMLAAVNSAASLVVSLIVPEKVLMSNPFAFVNKKPKVSEGSVVVGFVMLWMLKLRSSLESTLVVPEKLNVIWIISGLVDTLEHVKVVDKAMTPLQVIVPEGALT